MYCKVSKAAIAYDTPFVKSKVPFACTIATFRGRSFKPAVVVLCKNAFMGFSGDAHLEFQVQAVPEHGEDAEASRRVVDIGDSSQSPYQNEHEGA